MFIPLWIIIYCFCIHLISRHFGTVFCFIANLHCCSSVIFTIIYDFCIKNVICTVTRSIIEIK